MAETLRTWPALDLEASGPVPEDAGERVALAIDDAAAVAVEHDDDRRWRVYFATSQDRLHAASLLRASLGGAFTIASLDVPDEGWATKVQSVLRAVKVGRLIVCPPWDVPSLPPPGELVVVIEPSTGFGTGHHQSTRLCLLALQRLALGGTVRPGVRDTEPGATETHAHQAMWNEFGLGLRGCRVVDVGTGSGVLAIAARLLGASDVLAIDNDADAVASARENAARNGASEGIAFATVDLAALRTGAGDVVLANLTALLLRRLAAPLGGLVAPGGYLVTSGFTFDQVAMVTDAFPDFDVEAREDEDDWVGLTLRRAR